MGSFYALCALKVCRAIEDLGTVFDLLSRFGQGSGGRILDRLGMRVAG